MSTEHFGGEGYGPRSLDFDRPSSARIYDCMLDGAHNTEADRALVARIRAEAPRWVAGARVNRSFLMRVVRFLAAQGIDQFLDLGSGIPTVGNVHEIAQAANPAARVVYVDYEAVAVSMARTMLADNDNATIVQADLRDPTTVLTDPDTVRLLDFSRPVGLLLIGVMLFIPEADRPTELVARYRRRLAPGSYLALSQVTTDGVPPEVKVEVDRAVREYVPATEQVTVRDRSAIEAWFTGTDLVEPGVVRLPDWRPNLGLASPDEELGRWHGMGGVGKVR